MRHPIGSHFQQPCGQVLAFPIEISDFDARLEWLRHTLGRDVEIAWSAAYGEAIKASAFPLAEYLKELVVGGRLDQILRIYRTHQRLELKRLACPSRPGRRPGDGAYWDDPLIDEMHQLIQRHEAKSAWEASGKVAERAQGASLLAKRRRLCRKYHKKYRRSPKPVL